jgi:ribosomal-protein-alanine N-acetyltransferase
MAIETERLILREWREADREPFARMNCDPAVMEFLPALLSRQESDAMVDRIEAHFAANGFGVWATEQKATGEFIGFVGLWIPRFEAHFTPCVEIGWRLAPAYWGKGFATEAAQTAMQYAFGELRLKELVSFTTMANIRSRRVMEKIGMTHDEADDFDHPSLPEGHTQRRHVLYRKTASRE